MGMNKFDTNKFERIYIDFDGDDKAEIIANDSNLMEYRFLSN